ncbi:HAD family hydrolase [Mesoaciditoga lauensis]|uniref:HAD family hydrolase n=1 Tax=Mesoaciditoga lauensis TaxID=1495039 RepID=UPI000568A1D9|nr:HAD family hydrolase [Mesoaciditoga lauensis]
MTNKPYLLFDAGGTILFPKFDWMASVLSSKGFEVEPLKIFKEFSYLNYEIDDILRRGENNPWNNEWFLKTLVERLSTPKELIDKVASIVIKEENENGLWASTFGHIKETLKLLKDAGYSMSIVSNSDGRVEKMISDVGLRKYFDKVYDSYLVGISKPDKGIFELALKELSLKPQDALFVGDMFYIDVLGANSCGIPAVHLDPFKYYQGWEGARIKGIEELPKLLEKNDMKDKNFFPFK